MLDVDFYGVDYFDVNYVVVDLIQVCVFIVSFERRVLRKQQKNFKKQITFSD